MVAGVMYKWVMAVHLPEECGDSLSLLIDFELFIADPLGVDLTGPHPFRQLVVFVCNVDQDWCRVAAVPELCEEVKIGRDELSGFLVLYVLGPALAPGWNCRCHPEAVAFVVDHPGFVGPLQLDAGFRQYHAS